MHDRAGRPGEPGLRELTLIPVFGLDFTSSPSPRKPLVLARGELCGRHLRVVDLRPMTGFRAFEAWLGLPGPWIAGLDLPLGLPRRFLKDLRWPLRWSAYVGRVGRLSRARFRAMLDHYRRSRPPGEREHRRRTDRLAGALSPQKLYGTPVALMFHEGAPRLLKAKVSVPPVCPRADDRTVLEAYPALVARWCVGRVPYKTDRQAFDPPRRRVRRRILQRLASPALREDYGVSLDLPAALARRMEIDHTGDSLDALLCAVQAAWARTVRRPPGGIPRDADAAEGWIVDPHTTAGRRAFRHHER